MPRLILQGILFSALLSTILPCTTLANNRYEKIVPAREFPLHESLSGEINAIFEDSRGLLWIGTENGLHSFTGYKINTLTHESLARQSVKSIHEDQKGRLWIGGDGRLTVYDYAVNAFTPISLPNISEDTPIRAILGNNTDITYVLSENLEIYTYNPAYSLIDKAIYESFDMKQAKVNDAQFIDAENILIATPSKLITYNCKTNIYDHILPQHTTSISSVATWDSNTILIAAGSEVFAYSIIRTEYGLNYELLNQVNLNTDSLNIARDFKITALATDPHGLVWVGTKKQGTFQISHAEKFFEGIDIPLLHYGSQDKNTPVQHIIASNRNCWMTSDNNALLRFPIVPSPFKQLSHMIGAPTALAHTRIDQVIAYGTHQALLITSENEILQLNTQDKILETFSLPVPKEVKYHSACLDNRGDLWAMASESGSSRAYRFHNLEQQAEIISSDQFPGFTPRGALCMQEDAFGNIWIGDNTNIYRIGIDLDGKVYAAESVFDYPALMPYHRDAIPSMAYDSQHDLLWVGTASQGLFRFDLTNNPTLSEISVTAFQKNEQDSASIPDNSITDLCILPNNTLWVATQTSGTCQVLQREGEAQFSSYTKSDDLLNNQVYALTYDNEQNLWIATRKGLIRYNVTEGECSSFDAINGLPFRMSGAGIAHIPGGEIIVPGAKDLCFFNPEDLPKTSFFPPIRFDHLYVNNQIVLPGESFNKRILLDKQLSELPAIELKASENSFSLELQALHYGNPKQHKLRYRMLPDHEEWTIVTSDDAMVRFNDIASGKNTLEVQTLGIDGSWSESHALAIRVRRSLWKSIWLRTLVLLTFLGLGYQYYKHRISHLKQAKEKLQKELDNQSNMLSETKDALDNSQQEIKNQKQQLLRHNDIQEEIRFNNEGLKQFNQLLGRYKDLAGLSQTLISKLVEYLGMQMGIIYLASNQNQNAVLQKLGSYACESNEINEGDILIGEGFVGTAFKRSELIELENIPDGYVKISSGLGEVKPGYICFVPIMQNNEKVGVIELASFKKPETYKIAFVRKLMETVTASVQLIQLIEQNKHNAKQNPIEVEHPNQQIPSSFQDIQAN